MPEYKAKISKETADKKKEQLVTNSNEEEKLFIKDLSAALRRFISRYLVWTSDINENNSLEYFLIKIDLWGERYSKMNNLDEFISQKISSFNLKVGQAFEFYNLIGDEDKKEILEMINEKTKNKVDDEDEFEIAKKKPQKELENEYGLENDDDEDEELYFHKKSKKNYDI